MGEAVRRYWLTRDKKYVQRGPRTAVNDSQESGSLGNRTLLPDSFYLHCNVESFQVIIYCFSIESKVEVFS